MWRIREWKFSIAAKFFVVIAIFVVVFVGLFISFQQHRERDYRIDLLNTRLKDYNNGLFVANKDGLDTNATKQYIQEHPIPNLRVTIIDEEGWVVYDNKFEYQNIKHNHLQRKEISMAREAGYGYSVSRMSETMEKDYFYGANYYPKQKLYIRTALPYDAELNKMLASNKRYLYFAICLFLLLVAALTYITKRLNNNVKRLQNFAFRAEKGEHLDIRDADKFSKDELGEIASKIVSLYIRLQDTKMEQTKLKKELTDNVAHELKTPTASIQGYLETILENTDMNPELKQEFLQRCYKQSLRLSALLDDISTLNKMDGGRINEERTEINIKQIIDNIKDDVSLALEKQNINFRNLVSVNTSLVGNYSLIYSIFRNLTDNAISYASATEICVRVLREDNEKYYFEFRDNGVGVEEKHLQRLFERFYRVDKGRSRKLGGTGLGLAIVKNAVIQHGGEITASNDHGLCFHFSLSKI